MALLDKPPGRIPTQSLLVLGPHMRIHGPHVHARGRLGREGGGAGEDMVERRGGEAEGAVGAQQRQGLDVDGVLGRRRRGVGLGAERRRLEAAHEAADHDGVAGREGIVPEHDAREEPRGRRVEGAAVEGVRVRDGQEEGVDAAQGGDVGARHGHDARLRVQGKTGAGGWREGGEDGRGRGGGCRGPLLCRWRGRRRLLQALCLCCWNRRRGVAWLPGLEEGGD